MSVVWPNSFPQLMNQEDFDFVPGDSTIRTGMDIGPDKVRRRMTKSVDQMTCSFIAPFSQFQDIYDFWDTDCDGGATAFSFPHPITRSNVDVRFLSPPEFKPLGGGNLTVIMKLEVLP